MPPSVDGSSLIQLFRGQAAPAWRDAALVEHHGPVTNPSDPDAPPAGSGNPLKDPFELMNTASKLTPKRRATLHSELAKLSKCHTNAACRRAVPRQ